jgi:hypothetical protein
VLRGAELGPERLSREHHRLAQRAGGAHQRHALGQQLGPDRAQIAPARDEQPGRGAQRRAQLVAAAALRIGRIQGRVAAQPGAGAGGVAGHQPHAQLGQHRAQPIEVRLEHRLVADVERVAAHIRHHHQGASARARHLQLGSGAA